MNASWIAHGTVRFWAGLVMLTAGSAWADWSVKVAEKASPGAVAEEIRNLLSGQSVQWWDGGKLVYEFWFAKDVPLKAKPSEPGKGIAEVPEAAILAAAQVHATRRDYRDDELRAGVYTVRLGLQPQDGNHLGTSEFAYFAVLVPASIDTTVGGITTYKQLVKASSRETTTDHPLILSLRPATSVDGEFPRLNEPAPDHQSALIKLAGKVKGQAEATPIVFDLVHVGAAKH